LDSGKEFAMSKILLGAAAIATAAFAASTAYAMGGGNSPPSASPYAILEPQTVNPELAAPSARRSAFTVENGAAQPRGDVTHVRRGHRSHRSVPVQE
jgi:hypothetical protein